ncbi:hypothetical protein LCGC14_2985020, partial [marine sediment metagenome]
DEKNTKVDFESFFDKNSLGINELEEVVGIAANYSYSDNPGHLKEDDNPSEVDPDDVKKRVRITTDDDIIREALEIYIEEMEKSSMIKSISSRLKEILNREIKRIRQ